MCSVSIQVNLKRFSLWDSNIKQILENIRKLFFIITAKRMHSVESENTATKMSYYLSVG